MEERLFCFSNIFYFRAYLSLIKTICVFLLCALIGSLLVLSIQLGSAVFLKPCSQALKSRLFLICDGKECTVKRLDSGRFYLRINDFLDQKAQIQLCGAKEGFVNLDSPRQSQIEALLLRREDPSPSEKGDEEDRFGKVTASSNSQNLTERRIYIDAPKKAKFLMIRKGFDILGENSVSHFKISVQNGESIEIKGEPSAFTKRFFIPLPEDQKDIHVTIESLDSVPAKLVIDEIGLFKKIPETKNKQKHYKINHYWKFCLIACLGVCFFLFLNNRQATIYGSIYFFIFVIALQLSSLFLLFSPEWGRDLRAYFISESLQLSPGCNSNYGLYMASSILQGKGPLICGQPPWCRMPGYGFILALAGNAFDLLQMSIHGVLLQILLFALSLSFFFWAALRLLSPFVASLIATSISFLAEGFHHLQIESIMPTIILICSAIGCLFCAKYYKNEKIPLGYHILLHFAFALWFFLRTDILPAWAIVSLFFYGKSSRSWKYFLIPVSFALTIGLSWAFFKLPFTKEFSMTTESIGASLMVGLWEIPHKFVWTVSDGAYFLWLDLLNLPFGKKVSSDLALVEIFRFCFTYPIYTLSLILHKFLLFAKGCLENALYPGSWKGLYLLAPLFISFTLRYRCFQTFILSWPVLFNIPVFFLFYASEGRFYAAPIISLIVASFSLLLDRGFYRKMITYWGKTAIVLIAFLSILWFGPSVDEYLIKNDKLRYWAPFLDPFKSTLNVLAKK